MTCTIENGRDFSGDTHAARCIFIELALTGLGYDNFRHSNLFSVFGHGRFWGAAPFVSASGQ
jgi:hypothetical protein